MFYTKKELLLFGISPSEMEILQTLSKHPHLQVTDIALKTGVPRTTVHFLLNKLSDRKLVEKIRCANHFEWKRIPDEEFSEQIENFLTKFKSESKKEGDIENGNTQIEVYSGKEKVKEAYRKVFQVGRKRVYMIQGNKSAELTETIEEEYVTKFHQELRSRSVVVEAVVGESILKEFDTMGLRELRSHLDRTIIVHIIPDQFIDFEIDIVILEDQIFFINLAKEKVVFIKDRAIIAGITGLFHLGVEMGSKIDLNDYIRKLIEKKQKPKTGAAPAL